MKKANRKRQAARRRPADDILPEYDFSAGRRNKYAARYARGGLVVTLDPDVAVAFPGARVVNDALRKLAGLPKKRHVRRPVRRTA
jgi:hypothetical protein